MKKRTLIILILLFIAGLVAVFVWSGSSKSTVVDNSPKSDSAKPKKTASVPPSSLTLLPTTVSYKDGSQATFELAKPFRLAVAAEGLGKVRFMAMSPDGRMFVPDMVNMNLSHEGKIYVLGDFDNTTKQFKTKDVYLSGLRGPNGIAFYTDKNGKQWIYIALTASIIRYPYSAGDTKPSAKPEIVTTFPNKQVAGESSIVWHITRTIKFYDDRLYVSVGSGCNSCEQPEGEMRAMIYSMDPTGGDKQIYADGLRNAVGFTMADGELYATVNGVDHLGDEVPNDVMYKLTKGAHYGWPYCYESNGQMYPDTSRTWKRQVACAQAILSFAAFDPHAAPLGIEYFSKNSHQILKNTFLVALHGSFDPEVGSGYHIVRVSKDGKQDVFMDGFLDEKEVATGWFINFANAHTEDQPTGGLERFARPVDILQKDANSFFFTDDYKGRVYYVYAE